MVVSTNPLHAGNGVGVVQQVRGEQAKVEFRPTVFSKPPHLTESRILNVNELRAVQSLLERLRDGEIKTYVEKILDAKKNDPNADTSALERGIDRLVYKLYDLKEEEIRIVEGG